MVIFFVPTIGALCAPGSVTAQVRVYKYISQDAFFLFQSSVAELVAKSRIAELCT